MLFRQIRVLTGKDLKIVGLRRWFSTFLRALALPIAYIIFIAYARSFFLPPSEYGFGVPRPIRDLTTEVFNSSTSLGGRDRVIFINDGFTGGEIDILIERLSRPLRAAGADVRILPNEDGLLEVCQSSLSGSSLCYASASFHSSPSEGDGGVWSYTARIDAGLGLSVHVSQGSNAAQLYVLPFLQAIDSEIARMSGSVLPSEMLEQPFTYETAQDRRDDVQQFFMSMCSEPHF
jgi:ATP-binding cassette, subfamily A (ABC1), member 3